MKIHYTTHMCVYIYRHTHSISHMLIIPNMNDRLPSEISIDILSRLPLPTILTCKCVCKKWLQLLSSLEFAQHHLTTMSDKTEPGLALIDNNHSPSGPSSCKIFEFEDVLDLPSHDHHYKRLTQFDPKSFITSPNPIISVVGSVNGLLCLQDSRAQLDSYYICNPLTREHVSVPGHKETIVYPDVVAYGFGVSSLTGQYKVVRINHKAVQGPVRAECIVYTLGTGSWRSIEPGGSYEYLCYSAGAFLNGFLHWLVGDEHGSQLISRFDLETEDFEPMSPPFPCEFPNSRSLVVLEGCLCYCDHGSDEEVVVWVMRDYGSEEYWTKLIVIDKNDAFGFISHEAIFPLKVFKDGDILVLVENSFMMGYSTKNKSDSEIAVFGPYGDGSTDAILHMSSFLPLKRFELENVKKF